ncbi:MBL fold metallo-hydrolase [Helicobacter japonicus]|uniref:MBL fold metallo-hydrolase n=1 Tax=Helicobacter japonicus TaxID=425400 RepID=A0A4U8TSE8_9HELI|nr:MBL fold metallo-hydrolase [Helicobacter japonicus]TLE03454.1 MBL fold metallo-hydrolase [Helicobacter japonicus]
MSKISHKVKNHNIANPIDLSKDYSVKEQCIRESYSHYEDSILRFLLESFLPHKDIVIPSIKSNICNIPTQDSFVWFGHSSYMLWLNGKSILFDPLIGDNASPLPYMFRAFNGADIFSAGDFGSIDYLIITHNHYDHLSKASILALKDKIKCIIVPLGIGKILRKWGMCSHHIVELDWGENISFEYLKIHCLPSKHYSARSFFDKNTSLWACFVVQGGDERNGYKNIFCSGDSGYGGHFRVIGEQFQNMDFAFIENGQYNMRWAQNHLFPHQTLQAAIDIRCKRLMPIHNSKFALAPHHFAQPLESLCALYDLEKKDYPFLLLTPRIGEILPLWEDISTTRWWEQTT